MSRICRYTQRRPLTASATEKSGKDVYIITAKEKPAMTLHMPGSYILPTC